MREPWQIFRSAWEGAATRPGVAERRFGPLADAISDAGQQTIAALRADHGWAQLDAHRVACRMVEASVDWLVAEDGGTAALEERLQRVWEAERRSPSGRTPAASGADTWPRIDFRPRSAAWMREPAAVPVR